MSIKRLTVVLVEPLTRAWSGRSDSTKAICPKCSTPRTCLPRPGNDLRHSTWSYVAMHLRIWKHHPPAARSYEWIRVNHVAGRAIGQHTGV